MAMHVVTGSSGFLGGHIVRRLRAMGEDVIAFDLLDPSERISGATYVRGDVCDAGALDRAIAGADDVFHNAALVPLTKSGGRFFEVNVGGTKNVIAACRRHGVKKLVHMSSSAIYGVPEVQPITAETPYAPVEIYGRSKLEADQAVAAYIREGGHACSLRPRTLVGGESRLGIFEILFDWISAGKNIYIIGDGSNLFQFLHVEDLIDAAMKAAFSDRSGLYNIGTDRFGTLREDLEALIIHAHSTSRVVSLPVALTMGALRVADLLKLSPLAPWHYLTYHKPFVFDISKAVTELDWHPKYGNREALAESYDWYIAHRHELVSSAHSAHTKPVRQKLLKIVKWFS